jgi:hypothetical protein
VTTAAVMQPYLFPYLGYYQLVAQADVFVLYDDAAFIKQGYINRNSILVDGAPYRFTVPVIGASSNRPIRDVRFGDTGKLRRTLREAYARAPQFTSVQPLVDAVLAHPERSVTALCGRSIADVLGHLGVQRRIVRSSELDYDRGGAAADKLVAICRAVGATHYVNSAGGRALYDKAWFAQHGITLSFLDMQPFEYPQRAERFVQNLSMIDLLMCCPREDARAALDRYVLA